MNKLSKILLAISIVLFSFGYWGVFTVAGNKVFDEMDGYIPFGALLLSGVTFIVFCIVLALKRRAKTKQ